MPGSVPQVGSAAIVAPIVADSARDQVVRNVYDNANRLAYSIDPLGAVVQFTYDANGNVTQKTAYANTVYPSGTALRFPNNSTQINRNLGVFQAGDVVTVSAWFKADDPAIPGQVFFNGGNGWALFASSSIEHSQSGEWRVLTAKLDITTTQTQDLYVYIANNTSGAAAGRAAYFDNFVVSSVKRGVLINDTFDTLASWGGPASTTIVTSPAGPTLPFAQVAPLIAADASRDQVTRSVYDAANRLSYSIDPLGAVVQYSYDANGNVVGTTAYGTAVGAPSVNSLSAEQRVVSQPVAGNGSRPAPVGGGTVAVRQYTVTQTVTRTLANQLPGSYTFRLGIDAPALSLTLQKVTAIFKSDGQQLSSQVLFDAALSNSTGNPDGPDLPPASPTGYVVAQIPAGSHNVEVSFTSVYFDLSHVPVSNFNFTQIDPSNLSSASSAQTQHPATFSLDSYTTDAPDLTLAGLNLYTSRVATPAIDQTTRKVYDAANRLAYLVDGEGDVTGYQ